MTALMPPAWTSRAGRTALARLFFCLLCFFCLSPSLSATTVSGAIHRPDGSPLTGTIEFVLSQPARTTTPPVVFAPVKTTCAVTGGLIAAGCAVQGNDTLDPAGTYYRVRVLDANNLVVLPTANYTLSGAAVDFGQLPVTASDTLVPPTGAVTGNLNVTGNLTVGGTATFGADPQDFAHLRLLGQTADPASQSAGSVFYRSDLDRIRFRSGGLEVFDGAQYLPVTAPALQTFEFGGNIRIPDQFAATFKRMNEIRLVDPNLWTEAGVPAKIDAAISDCVGSTCLVVYPSNLGAGEATTLPENATVLDLRQTAFDIDGTNKRVAGLLLRRRLTQTPSASFNTLHDLHLYLDATDGGAYNSSSKITYAPLRLDLDGRTRGQHILIGGRVFGYGISDALFLGGTIWGYGGKQVTGTSQPTAEFAEVSVKQGATIFTATVSGDPAASATVITYTGAANESVLGERALINTSQTETTGTVSSIATDTVTFSGAPDWTTFTPSPVGQYFKVNADDVTLGGTSTGHWYRVSAVLAATQLQLETNYDTTNLATSGAYTLAQGAEITAFDTTAKTLTIEANSYDWAAADALISPPMPLLNFRGLNLLLTKEFWTGTSRGIDMSNAGPFPWASGILIEGTPASGRNAFNTGLKIISKSTDAIDVSGATLSGAALKLAANQVIRWGTSSDLTNDGTRVTLNDELGITGASASVVPFFVKHAASPTTDFFQVRDSSDASVLAVNSSKVLRLNVGGTNAINIDPVNLTYSAAGGGANQSLLFNTKGTGAVKVNSTASTGTGGFEVWDGAVTPTKLFSVGAAGLDSTNTAAPAIPAAGVTRLWTDSTDKNFKAKDDAGVVSVTVQPTACAGTDKISAISAAGVVTCSTDQVGGAGGGYDSVAADTGTASKTSTESLKFAGTAGEISTVVTTDDTTQDIVTWSLPATLSTVKTVSAAWLFTGGPAFRKDDIKAVATDAFKVENTTASDAVNTVQYSPAVRFTSHAWNTTPTAADNPMEWRVFVIPTSGATPASKITWQRSNNGGAFAEQASLSNTGIFDVATGYRIAGAAATNNVLAGDGTNFVSTVTSGTGAPLGTGRTLTGGAGIGAIGDLSADRTIATDSTEASFLSAAAITCGAATAGKMAVTAGGLNWCDNTATPVLRAAPVNTTATASQFFTAFDSTAGTFTKAQPAFTDISGTHVLADTIGLGAQHSTSGLTAGQVLRASGATTAAFASILDGDLPASISRDTETPAAGDISGSLSAGYTINAGAVASAELATANKTGMKSIVIFDPVTGDTNRVQLYFGQAVTITRVACSVAAATSVTIQLDERAEATPNTAGTNVMTAALACTTTSGTTTSFTNAGIAARVPLNLQITAVTGTPGTVRVHIEYTVD